MGSSDRSTKSISKQTSRAVRRKVDDPEKIIQSKLSISRRKSSQLQQESRKKYPASVDENNFETTKTFDPSMYGFDPQSSLTKLKHFDLCSKYGPCIGPSRLQRWKRAKEFGLDPPREVLHILQNKSIEHEIDKKIVQRCLWYEEFEEWRIFSSI